MRRWHRRRRAKRMTHLPQRITTITPRCVCSGKVNPLMTTRAGRNSYTRRGVRSCHCDGDSNQARLYRKADGAKCSCSTIIGLVTTAQSTPQDALSEGGSEQIVPLIMLPHGEEARLYSVFTAENIGKDRITVKQHPYMLAFALTDFKLQGRTLNKLVISIPKGVGLLDGKNDF